MITNEQGLEIIKTFEGLVDGDPNTPGLEPYRCPSRIPTIGYGSTYYYTGNRVTMDDPAITEEEAESLLAFGMRVTENCVARLVRVPVTINQFSALVSLVYNIGSGNFQSSTLRMKLNRLDYIGASNEFWKWRRSRGIILNGLVRRRECEKQLFLA
jgi:lysozyme